jgi:hypothetical protein
MINFITIVVCGMSIFLPCAGGYFNLKFQRYPHRRWADLETAVHEVQFRTHQLVNALPLRLYFPS